MLVLSRTVGEGLLVGESQRLTVTAINPSLSATLQFESAAGRITKTMRRDETWEVQPDVRFTIIDLRPGLPDKVRIGIECPREMPVHRREIYEMIQREQNRPPSESTP